MKILAVETSTLLGGVALMGEAEGLIAEARLNVRSTHSERLMTEVDHLLRQAAMDLSEIDVFAIAIGPGSFTGLRIGLSTVKGFAYATGKPVVSVPSLEALAWNFPYSPFPVCAMFDARKKEVYAAVFRWNGKGFERSIEEASLRPADLVRAIEGPAIFAGEGAELYRETIAAAAGEKALFPPRHQMVTSPSSVAYLGLCKAKNGEFSEPVSLVPKYIRKSEAEVKMNAK
ncbi:MAG: tRNA (adenosine(37)-N6)-threonylcarbamoyltransferase complex dimerization subunit type 1 TsaB [Nitrospirae bacterium]|nr:tRNA (adenosine(37)-N6)-threonylcarbamoyltransferase complex dimerization subunit type 1 TsaB [Nitrospirota bacterium]